MTHTEVADLRLSTRIEQASSGSRELDAEIHEAVTSFPARRAGPGWADENALVVPVFPGWDILPAYTTSLDAAMKLVPEGMAWSIGWGQILPKQAMAAAVIGHNAKFVGYDANYDVVARAEAETPALALAAAAMRVRGL